jgi:membrane protease YdiL (CAAX protease family)
MVARATPAVLIIVTAFAALVLWELMVPVALFFTHLQMPELALYAVDKLGFAALLALTFILKRQWRVYGFAGGLAARRFGLMWPIWLDAAVALAQGIANPDPMRLLGWFAISGAVAFGEEGVFRGIVMTAIGLDRPRQAAAISAILFGTIHLIGLAGPFEWRLVVLQALAAGGIGLVLGCTRLITASIWPCVVAHTALDFFGIAAADGVADAMAYSNSELAFLSITGAVALGWGIVLWRRLPQAA